MAYLPPSPILALVLADPTTIQQFDTTNVNDNFMRIDSGIGADRTRLAAIEPRVLASGSNPGVVPAGTTAQRDAFWGVPSTAAARVALANKGARWFNTEKGYEEQYYALYTDTPTTVMSKETAGWKGVDGSIAHPTAVSGAGTGNSVTMRGNRVVFSNTTRVNVDGIFDQDFDWYTIMLRISANSGPAGDVLGKHRTAGVDGPAAAYRRSRNYIPVPASGNQMVTESTAGSVYNEVIFGAASLAHSYHVMDVYNPAIAVPTSWLSRSVDDRPLVQWAGSTGPSTAHDGFVLYASGTPTITGELVVIGHQGR